MTARQTAHRSAMEQAASPHRYCTLPSADASKVREGSQAMRALGCVYGRSGWEVPGHSAEDADFLAGYAEGCAEREGAKS